MKFKVYEETVDEGSGSVMERLHAFGFKSYREAIQFMTENPRYVGVDLELNDKLYPDVHTEGPHDWIEGKPPTNGDYVWMRGYHFEYPNTKDVVVLGRFDTGGWTEGWEDETGNWFVPEAWMPFDK